MQANLHLVKLEVTTLAAKLKEVVSLSVQTFLGPCFHLERIEAFIVPP